VQRKLANRFCNAGDGSQARRVPEHEGMNGGLHVDLPTK
jgi:hypothetical protein